MSHPFQSRRIVALIAAYVVALQALLLPLSVAAGTPDVSLCTSASSASSTSPLSGDGQAKGHASGCPCAAGCGTQCCSNAVASPPPAMAVHAPVAIAKLSPPPIILTAAQLRQHSPHVARAPPAA